MNSWYRYRPHKLLQFVAVLLALALVLGACSFLPGEDDNSVEEPGSERKEQQAEGQLVYAASGSPDSFNPLLDTEPAAEWVNGLVFASLVDIGSDLKPVPAVATDWEYSEEGRVWTFHLREDVYFHDGEQLTAEDVVFTYNAIKNEGYAGPLASDFEPLQQVEAVDDFTVRFYLAEPYAPFLTHLTCGILPAHLFAETPVAELGENKHNQEPIGAGPYRLDDWEQGQYIVLRAHNNYYGSGPNIQKLRLNFVQDSTVAVASLEAGEVDLLGLPPNEVQRMKEQHADRFNFYESTRLGFQYLGLNHERFGLNDVAVRQAIAYAVDRQKMVEDIVQGNGQLMHSPILEVSWAHTEQGLHKYEHDPDRAVELLQQAGFTRGEDGIFVRNGNRLSYTMLTNSDNKIREAMSRLVQKNLRDVGIEIKCEYTDWETLLKEHLWVGEMDMWLSGFALGVDPDPFVFYHSAMARKDDQGYFKGYNRAQFSHERVDELLEEGRQTLEREKRKEIYAELQQLLTEQVPWVWLYSYKTTYAVDKKVKGVEVSPLGLMNTEQWFIDDIDKQQ